MCLTTRVSLIFYSPVAVARVCTLFSRRYFTLPEKCTNEINERVCETMKRFFFFIMFRIDRSCRCDIFDGKPTHIRSKRIIGLASEGKRKEWSLPHAIHCIFTVGFVIILFIVRRDTVMFVPYGVRFLISTNVYRGAVRAITDF